MGTGVDTGASRLIYMIYGLALPKGTILDAKKYLELMSSTFLT